MELDMRILPGKRPLTCFDAEEAKKYVGKKCYLTNDISLFSDLDVFKDIEGCKSVPNEYDGIINTLSDIDTEISMVFETTYLRWKFCIPCEWVTEEKKEKEKKYKPYTVLQLSHDIVTRKLCGFITFRRKIDRHDIYILRYNGIFTENGVDCVCLGSMMYSMKELFDRYELKKDDEWQPFGKECEE